MTVSQRTTRQDRIVTDEMLAIPTVIMRGGTSKAVFLRGEDLPDDPQRRDEIILRLFGSPHARQIDGLGGADPLTSKLAIIDVADEDDEADVLYTFGQVSITEPTVDYTLNCGNISSAVGYYAIEEGLVEPEEPMTRVTIRNTNNDSLLTNEIQVSEGQARVGGDFSISGVNRTGARVNVGFMRPGGEVTGETFPLGLQHEITTEAGKTVPVTVVDAAGTPSMFLRAADFGVEGTELPDELDARRELIEELLEIQEQAAVESGIKPNLEEAKKTHIPAPVLLAEPKAYTDLDGGHVDPENSSLIVRRFLGAYPSDCHCHKAYAGTGTICLGVASQVEGTLVHEFVEREFEEPDGRKTVRIAHPSGTIDALIDLDEAGEVREVALARTARRLMDGTGYALLE